MKKVAEWLANDVDKLFDRAHGGKGKDAKFSRRMLSAGAKTNRSQSTVDPLTSTQVFDSLEFKKERFTEALL